MPQHGSVPRTVSGTRREQRFSSGFRMPGGGRSIDQVVIDWINYLMSKSGFTLDMTTSDDFNLVPRADDTGRIVLGTNTKSCDLLVWNGPTQNLLLDRGDNTLYLTGITMNTDSGVNVENATVTNTLTVGGLATVNQLVVNTSTNTNTLNVNTLSTTNSLVVNTSANAASANVTGLTTTGSLVANTTANAATVNVTGDVNANNVIATTAVNGATATFSGAGTFSNVVTGNTGVKIGTATDYGNIATGANGVTTISTVDSDGALGHLHIAADGNTTIGDGGTTDYVRFETDGSIRFFGAATQWDDIRVNPLSAKILGGGAANDPAFSVFKNTTRVYEFSDSTDNQIFFTIQMPHGWRVESNLSPHIHWSTQSNAAGGGVSWAFEYTWADINGTFGNTNIIYANATGSNTAYTHQIEDFPDLNASGKGISSVLICRLFRDVSSANDTYGNGAFLLEFDIHYEKDSLGSREEYTK